MEDRVVIDALRIVPSVTAGDTSFRRMVMSLLEEAAPPNAEGEIEAYRLVMAKVKELGGGVRIPSEPSSTPE